MTPEEHALFKQYPLEGKAAISTGEAPTPYHIYDGYGLFIGGACDLAAARDLLKNESVVPVPTSDGKALMGIWVCNFSRASLGPHHELQISFFVSRQEVEPLAPHPLNAPALMLARPDVQMLCFGLWNDTPRVVAYNRELLSLDAHLAESRIGRASGAVNFLFTDKTGGAPILFGAVRDARQASWRANLSLMLKVGAGKMLAAARQPWMGMQVVNPLGVGLQRNAAARTFTKNKSNRMRFFDPRGDSLVFGDARYRALGFVPHFVQHMDGFKFVYLPPEQAQENKCEEKYGKNS